MAYSKPKVFISYAREDLGRALSLYEALERANCDPWIDKKKLVPGMRWKLAVKETIQSSDFVLVCLSRRSVSKIGFFQAEQKEALDIVRKYPSDNIYLIPVRLEECRVPLELQVDCTPIIGQKGLGEVRLGSPWLSCWGNNFS